jgi:hypothetical protein
MTYPLIGWAVFRVTICHDPDGQILHEEKNAVEGVILHPTYGRPMCARDELGFLQYLSPDDPNPEPDQPVTNPRAG